MGTKRFPGYGCLLSWPLLPSVCPPQNLSVQRGGSLRPNGEGAFLACPLIIHDAHDQSLLLVLPDIRMYSETPFDAGMEWVYPHCLLLGGHGLVDPHLGDLLPSGDGIRAVLTLCCSSSPRVPNQLASFLPPLRALLPLSLAPVPGVSSGARWGGQGKTHLCHLVQTTSSSNILTKTFHNQSFVSLFSHRFPHMCMS